MCMLLNLSHPPEPRWSLQQEAPRLMRNASLLDRVPGPLIVKPPTLRTTPCGTNNS